MAFEPGVVRQASMRLARRKEARVRRREQLERELYRQEPELEWLDRELRGTMAELAGLAAAGKPLQADGPEVAAVRERNLNLQKRREELLRRLGMIPPSWRTSPTVLCAGTPAGRTAGCAGA